MPEGDTVHRTAERLRPMIGHEVTAARARPGPGLRRVPDLSRLVGARVLSVEARGKHLLIGFERGMTIRSHLRMTGSWRIAPSPAPRTWPMHRASAIIESRAWTAVAFSTPVIELLTDAELRRSQPLASLGSDLSPAISTPTRRSTASACEMARSSAARCSTSVPWQASATSTRARSRSWNEWTRGRAWRRSTMTSCGRPSPRRAASCSPTWSAVPDQPPGGARRVIACGSTADPGVRAGAADRPSARVPRAIRRA